MADLQLANAGTIETKQGFLVPPLTITVPSWDDLTQKTIHLEIYSRHGTLLFDLTHGDAEISVTPAQLVISPSGSPIGAATAKTGDSEARYATWGEVPAGGHTAVLRVIPTGTDAEIGLAFAWRHRAAHDTRAVSTALVTTLNVTDSGGDTVAVTVVLGGLTVAGFDALPVIAAVDPAADFLAVRDADGAVIGRATPATLGLGGGGGGEANDGQNLGPGAGLYHSKAGVLIRLRSLVSLSGLLSIVENGQAVEVDVLESGLALNGVAVVVAESGLSSGSGFYRFTAPALTLTIRSADVLNANYRAILVDEDRTSEHTVEAEGGQTIDGLSSVSFGFGATLKLYSDGQNLHTWT